MADLTPQYSSIRIVCEYLEKAYLASRPSIYCKHRLDNGGERAKAMAEWEQEQRVRRAWKSVHIGAPAVAQEGDTWVYTVPVYLGEMDANDIKVGIYADASAEDNAQTTELARSVPIPGAANGHLYTGKVSASRPSSHYTVGSFPIIQMSECRPNSR
jgi:glycogen phosphorylase